MNPTPLRLRTLAPPAASDASATSGDEEELPPPRAVDPVEETPTRSSTGVAIRRKFADPDHARPEFDFDTVDDLDEWVPRGGLRSWSLGRVGAAALLVVVLVCAGFALAQLLRSEPQTVSAPQLPGLGELEGQSESDALPPNRTASEGQHEPGGEVVVSVVGLVHDPGLVTLAPGARVADAIAAAGHGRERADMTTLNLARPVADGEQVVVGALPPGGAPTPGSGVLAADGTQETTGSESVSGGGDTEEPGGGGKVNLNSASATELESLNGVGPATASAIIEYRESSGPFSTVEQLAEVNGIGPAKLESLSEQVVV